MVAPQPPVVAPVEESGHPASVTHGCCGDRAAMLGCHWTDPIGPRVRRRTEARRIGPIPCPRVTRRLLGILFVVACVFGAAAAAVVSTGAGAGRRSAPVAAPTDPARLCAAGAGTTVRVSVDVDGRARTALVHVPHRRRGQLPVVMALHGYGANGAFMERYSGLSRVADREGFAVVYPDADGPRWRISAAEAPTDVRFLDALLDRLDASGCLDDDRVSAVGVSNGGGMAARFACAGEDRLAGLVSVAGGYSSLPRCEATRPISVLEIHGTADPVVPYGGRPGDGAGDVMRWLYDWIRRDACPSAARRRTDRPGVQRLDWAPCRAGTSVAHLRLLGGLHAWPGAVPADAGPSFGVSAAEEAWDFLRGHRRASAVEADTH